jgi:single-stranded DNA-specific DHH superfamily exonuclease
VKLRELTFDAVTALGRLEPFGNGNSPVQVLIRNLRLAGEIRKMGTDQKHARFSVHDGTGQQDVVWFNAGEIPTAAFDLAVLPEINYFNGTSRIQLKVLDLRQVN